MGRNTQSCLPGLLGREEQEKGKIEDVKPKPTIIKLRRCFTPPLTNEEINQRFKRIRHPVDLQPYFHTWPLHNLNPLLPPFQHQYRKKQGITFTSKNKGTKMENNFPSSRTSVVIPSQWSSGPPCNLVKSTSEKRQYNYLKKENRPTGQIRQSNKLKKDSEIVQHTCVHILNDERNLLQVPSRQCKTVPYLQVYVPRILTAMLVNHHPHNNPLSSTANSVVSKEL